ncbi:MAG TPA: hypothetical protein DIT98_04065, partial [Verrucomicrobiales bacterium]|nr:hypothetical protein [Verrucomicrobiales bacterium]
GFEPPIQFPVRLISSQVPSTNSATLPAHVLAFLSSIYHEKENYQGLNTKNAHVRVDIFPGNGIFQAGNEWILEIVDYYIFC